MNGRLVNTEMVDGFEIKFYADPEEIVPFTFYQEEVGYSEDEARDLHNQIAAGEYEWFMARVTASREEVVLGEDILGCCLYESAEEFCEKYHDDYYKDMVETAIEEAKEKIRKLCEAIPA